MHRVAMTVPQYKTLAATLSSTGEDGLTEAIYYERTANLYAFYNRLVDARLLNAAYVP